MDLELCTSECWKISCMFCNHKCDLWIQWMYPGTVQPILTQFFLILITVLNSTTALKRMCHSMNAPIQISSILTPKFAKNFLMSHVQLERNHRHHVCIFLKFIKFKIRYQHFRRRLRNIVNCEEIMNLKQCWYNYFLYLIVT